MQLVYDGKKTIKEILDTTAPAKLKSIAGKGSKNKLIQSENIHALKALQASYAGKVDLIYIDPPFSTNGDYRISEGRASAVSKNNNGLLVYSDRRTGEEYLEFLRERLILMRELLSDHGSIYLHIDYKIGHYVKLIMDEVFGRSMFRNDITRIKCNPKNFSRNAYGNIKDMILFYSKSKQIIWNDPKLPFSGDDVERLFKKTDRNGRRYTTIPLHAPGETIRGKTNTVWRGMQPPKGRHWRTDPTILEEWHAQGLIEWSANGVPRKKIFIDERNGKKMQDIWDFKDPQYPEYPTEKNSELLTFIIKASSNEHDLVLDCFAGSGTTLIAAESLHRRWIGIDASPHAIDITKKKLNKMKNIPKYEFLKQIG